VELPVDLQAADVDRPRRTLAQRATDDGQRLVLRARVDALAADVERPGPDQDALAGGRRRLGATDREQQPARQALGALGLADQRLADPLAEARRGLRRRRRARGERERERGGEGAAPAQNGRRSRAA
jgi:hypothetical protein